MADSNIHHGGQGVTRAELYANRAAGLKRCMTCKGVKPFADFARCKTRSDGFTPVCRQCAATYRKQRSIRDPGWTQRQSAANREKNADRLNEQARAAYHRDIEVSRSKARAKRTKDPDHYREKGREYRARNPEKARAASAASKRKNAEAVKAYNAAYRKANKALICERGKAYREANKDVISSKAKAVRKIRVATDPAYIERCRKSVAAYAARNPEVIRAIHHNRKARIRGAEGTHSAADVAEILKLQRKRCANPACRASLRDGYHVDHIVPVARGGSNDRRNLQLLCQPCNLHKHAKDPIDWAQENGLLL